MQVAGHRRPQITQFTQIDSSLHRTEKPQITQMDADTIARLNRKACLDDSLTSWWRFLFRSVSEGQAGSSSLQCASGRNGLGMIVGAGVPPALQGRRSSLDVSTKSDTLEATNRHPSIAWNLRQSA